MTWAAVAGIGAGLVGSLISADASGRASDAQMEAGDRQIAESRRQFDEIQKLLAPYSQAGVGALQQQQALLGLNGQEAQFNAIQGINNSPQMAEMLRQGENSILQNASATGGLRGGNTQAALAQFRPQLLNQLIEQQFSKLGGLTTLGQNSAAGIGTAGQNSSGQIIAALGQQGQAKAGGILGRGQAGANLLSGISGAAGLAYGKGGGFGNLFGDPQSSAMLPPGFTGSESFGNRGFTGYGR